MNLDELTRIENDSIRAFVQGAADSGFLSGRVLDYGCGRSPYRGIVEAAGSEYIGYDRASFPANMSGVNLEPKTPRASFDTVLCTQVIQFHPEPLTMLEWFKTRLKRGGHLVITGPESWPNVNRGDDLFRFTLEGATHLLCLAYFEPIREQERWGHGFDDFNLSAGWGIIASA